MSIQDNIDVVPDAAPVVAADEAAGTLTGKEKVAYGVGDLGNGQRF